MSEEPEFVDPDDLSVSRNSSGEIVPEVHEAGSLGKVKVIPMTYGDVEEYFGDDTKADIDASEMATLFNEFFVEPSLDVSGQDVRDMKPLAPANLLSALMDASGIDADVEVDEAGDATVDVEGNI